MPHRHGADRRDWDSVLRNAQLIILRQPASNLEANRILRYSRVIEVGMRGKGASVGTVPQATRSGSGEGYALTMSVRDPGLLSAAADALRAGHFDVLDVASGSTLSPRHSALARTPCVCCPNR